MYEYAVEDLVMYGAVGVCKVTDICSPDFMRDGSLYYVLQPVYNASETIYAKIGSDKISMRRSLTREEAQNFIEEMRATEVLWYTNDKERDVEFKRILKSGDCKEWIRMVKGLYHTKKQKESDGKKLSQADTNIFQKAEKLLYGELALALGLTMEEMPSYIDSVLS